MKQDPPFVDGDDYRECFERAQAEQEFDRSEEGGALRLTREGAVSKTSPPEDLAALVVEGLYLGWKRLFKALGQRYGHEVEVPVTRAWKPKCRLSWLLPLEGVELKFTYSNNGHSMRISRLRPREWITIAILAEQLGAETLIEVVKYLLILSCCPILVIELARPHIRVRGAATYIDKPAYQFHSVPCYLQVLQDSDHLPTLSRALASIGDLMLCFMEP
ncbi:hypothetical protein SELMODRAFT_407934 [Selaginella moellendorffii]|uniref:Uncharacterized protein n=1 Tax=Selaginella moellendorffii TaxID=88036 RepID=D8R585_SELML|nr:hypothetical protein SELMODRAFT_407934 [Selaginella moellendorffii]